MIRRFL